VPKRDNPTLEIEMRLLSLLVGAFFAIGATASAEAAVYNFTIDAVDYDVSGRITTTGNLITSMSGQITGLLNAPITGLAGQPNIYYTSDNQVTLLPPYVTNAGALFEAGTFFFNIYSVANGPGYNYYLSTNQFGADYYTNPLFNPGNLILGGTITAVPELSTWIMMIVGFLGVGVIGLRRRTQGEAARSV
jgi:hypothetical protein